MSALESKPKRQSSKSYNLTQREIIDRFIKTKHSRINPSGTTGITEDLSSGSTKIGDYLLTESLAEIFLSQGKSDKAIEIYKKLIWKFPQKRAYFASQIDKLRKG